MAKKTSNNSSKPVAEMNDQMKRKKQAKKEAKLMLDVEEAKLSIQQAEKRLAKAQARLEACNTHLRTLEAELTEFRASHDETEVNSPDTGFDHQNGQPDLDEETVFSAQNGNLKQEAKQPKSMAKEATISPDTASNH